MKLQQKHFHFIGIGGIGMCGLAELLLNMGSQVSGSDLAENHNTERLKSLGAEIFIGHRRENLKGADVVVYSSAVPASNPEMIVAREKRIPVIPRAEALAELMRLKRGLAVAGTHGKTTTTSMLASILLEAQLSPTIFVGGLFSQIKSTAWLGQGEWLVAEADESDGSFHKLSPEFAIITNIDSDHLDHYKNMESIESAFYDFALKIPFYGQLVVCGDDARIRRVFENYPKNILYYGFESENDYSITGADGHYQIMVKDYDGQKRSEGELRLQVPGQHNALNALAAYTLARSLGVSQEFCRQGLYRFDGVDRRMQKKGEAAGVLVYDDYAHHPTEILATLQAAREKFKTQRIVICFQPHRYTRTQFCWNDFKHCFKDADNVYVTPIYAAGETPIPLITAERLIESISHPQIHFFDRSENEIQKLTSHLRSGDVFLTLGAGDGWKIGMEVLKILREKKQV